MNDASRGELEKLREMIRSTSVGMLTTIDGDRQLVSRPMLALLDDSPDAVCFLTHTDSDKVDHVSRDPRVGLTFVGSDGKHVSITGRAELSRDPALVARLWHPTYRAWFPGGRDDATLVVLRVVMDHADYWEAPTSRVVRVFGAAKAILTGERYETERQTIDLKD